MAHRAAASVVGMAHDAKDLLDISWDVVQDVEGFSAEATVEHEMTISEAERMTEVAGHLAPAVRESGSLHVRGSVTIDDSSLWVAAHVLGPGRFDDTAREAALRMLDELWDTVRSH